VRDAVRTEPTDDGYGFSLELSKEALARRTLLTDAELITLRLPRPLLCTDGGSTPHVSH
jgi:hypothetical protein